MAAPGLGRPDGTELRTGVDLSLAHSTVTPLVFFGYVPWRRSAIYLDPSAKEWTAYRTASLDRGEYRLSMPIGVAFVRDPDPGESIGACATLAIVPEITLAHRNLENPVTDYDTTRVEQRWAVFVTVRVDIVVLSHLAHPE